MVFDPVSTCDFHSVKKQRYERDFNSYLNGYFIPNISKKGLAV